MYAYDPVGFIYKIEPELSEDGEAIKPGEFQKDISGKPIFHVNSRPGRYPEEAEPFLIPPPKTPFQVFAGVPVEDTIFFAFPDRETAESCFGIEEIAVED